MTRQTTFRDELWLYETQVRAAGPHKRIELAARLLKSVRPNLSKSVKPVRTLGVRNHPRVEINYDETKRLSSSFPGGEFEGVPPMKGGYSYVLALGTR